MKYFLILPLLSVLLCCQEKESSAPIQESSNYGVNQEEFASYWYSGKAELASYNIIQTRYGEKREGNAMMIFVTEPFSSSKQVKADDPNKEGVITVMKLNYTKKFQTGIYPYSMMTSIFTPVDDYHYPETLKSTTSSQEWCGHSFIQYNQSSSGYQATGFSYFESEGDIEADLGRAYFEDELFTRIRINPNKLPVGTHRLIPSGMYQRLSHDSINLYTAELGLVVDEKESLYKVEYLDSDRSMQIRFSSSAPFTILGWKEFQNDVMVCEAELNQTLQTDYWRQNSLDYEYLYDSLISP